MLTLPRTNLAGEPTKNKVSPGKHSPLGGYVWWWLFFPPWSISRSRSRPVTVVVHGVYTCSQEPPKKIVPPAHSSKWGGGLGFAVGRKECLYRLGDVSNHPSQYAISLLRPVGGVSFNFYSPSLHVVLASKYPTQRPIQLLRMYFVDESNHTLSLAGETKAPRSSPLSSCLDL